jgi:hypothetical protein
MIIKATLFSSLCLFFSFQVSAQKNEVNIMKGISFDSNGEVNTLYSIPHYDSMGNLFQIRKRYECLPTQADSIAFANSISGEIHKMMEEYGREQQEYYESIKTMNIQMKKQNPKSKRKIKQKRNPNQQL